MTKDECLDAAAEAFAQALARLYPDEATPDERTDAA